MCFTALQKNRDISVLLLRLAVAGIFIAHGWMKVSHFSALPPLMRVLAVAEPLGGIAMLLGVRTRWAGLGLAIIMLGAIYTKVSGGMGYAASGGWEFDTLILASCIMMMTTGPGKYSVGAMMNT